MKINHQKKETCHARIKANQCQHCGYTPEELGIEKWYAYLGGGYCSRECYQTLFGICDICDKKNMTVVTNARDKGEKICDKCYDKREGLSVCTIVCKF